MSRISPSYVTGLEKYIHELLNQVSTLKVELREICAAIDDPASDLTLTTVECIKKLKAEQRVAEAFLKALNGKLAHTFGHDCADALKANWREYL